MRQKTASFTGISVCRKSLVITMTMIFLGKSFTPTFTASCLLCFFCNHTSKTAAFLVLLVMLFIPEVVLFPVLVPFLSLQYSHRTDQLQSSQSKLVSHCWRASQSHRCLQDWPLCCADHGSVTVQPVDPNRQGKAYVQMVFIFTSDLTIYHLQEQPVTQKEKVVRFFHSRCCAK